MVGSFSKVVLIGASGTVGSHVLSALLEDPKDDFKITLLSRQESKSTFASHNATNVLRADFDDLALLTSTFKGHDAIIHAGSISSLPSQTLMIEAAIQAGVSRFILNEFANSPINQTGLPEFEPFRKTKREVLELAKQKAEQNPEFSWSALATGNFLDYSLKKFPQLGIDIKQRQARLVDDGTGRFSAVTLKDIGTAVRGILRRPEETKNRFLHIRSVESCQMEILEALKVEMGEGEWKVTYADSEEMYAIGKAAFARGEMKGKADLLVVQLFAKDGKRSIVVGREVSDNDLLGVCEKDIGEVVRDVLASFEPPLTVVGS